MTVINLISKSGNSKQADISFSDLINTPIGATIDISIGFGFQLKKKYEKVSDYTFKEV